MARAVRFDRFGGDDVLYIADVPAPQPGAGDVIVQVLAAGINPGEAKIREGAMAQVAPSTFPSGQGSDLAGVVHAVGASVSQFSVGDEVLGWNYQRAAQADLVSCPADQLVAKPLALDWIRAGGLFIVGATAWAAVQAVEVRPGDVVVVSAAAGGVGSIAVQLARRGGARVLGIAGSANADWLRSVGVEPVEYGDGLADRLRDLAPDGIDAFVDTYGDGYVDLAVELGIAPGRIDTIIDFAAAQKYGVHADGSAQGTSADVLRDLADLVAWGEIVLPIAGVYPFEQVRAAYADLASGHSRGKIVLSMTADQVSKPA